MSAVEEQKIYEEAEKERKTSFLDDFRNIPPKLMYGALASILFISFLPHHF